MVTLKDVKILDNWPTLLEQCQGEEEGRLWGVDSCSMRATECLLIEPTVNLRNPTSAQGTDFEEIEANTFAGLLLIPERFLLRDLAEEAVEVEDDEDVGRIAASLARKYKVSQQAMTFRLLDRLPR